jgi:arsenate reductase
MNDSILVRLQIKCLNGLFAKRSWHSAVILLLIGNRKPDDIMTGKIRVLFICTANAARSQMAEGLLLAKYGERYEVFSAGTRQSRVSVRAIEVMKEIGIDISGHRSKTLAEFEGFPVDLAVTLCDKAHAVCPVVPGAKKTIHHGFADPHLTPGTDDDVLEGYRRVRDAIVAWIDREFGKTAP